LHHFKLKERFHLFIYGIRSYKYPNNFNGIIHRMTQTNTTTQNLLVIDSQVTDWQSLAAGVGAETAVLILDSGADGLT
jgi:hypothetical protein